MTWAEIGLTLKGARTVWYRDVLSLLRDRPRLAMSILMAVVVLVGLGFGLGGAIGNVGGGGGIPGIPYIQFVFPVLLSMNAMFTALQSTMSIVWDREFGFMRKILVAPISRTSVALGKVAGGVTVAIIQVAITLVAAPFIGLHLSVATVLAVLLVLVLVSAAATALGVLVAARQKSMQAFQGIAMLVMMPLMALSMGSFLPALGAGTGVAGSAFRIASQINPVAYGIDALRQLMLGSSVPAAMTLHAPLVDALILVAFFVAFLAPGVALFRKRD
jgi:ABC-2 type transport system permease protein